METAKEMRAKGPVGCQKEVEPSPEGRIGAARAPGNRQLAANVIELTAERLRVVAEPNRIGIMAVLNEMGEATVQELADCLGAPHQRVSKHLAVLHYSGIVSRRRGEGTTILYRLIDWSSWWVVEQIAGSVRSDPEGVGGGT